MAHVRIAGVALDGRGQTVVLLKRVGEPDDEGKALPIWIGELEASSILIAVQGERAPRPLAHDLMASLVTELGAEVERVEITRLEAGTFYAEVVLQLGGGEARVDARPSDAIALALRTGAPLYAADEVLESAGVAGLLDAAAPEGSTRDDHASIEEFREFLDQVDPEDFQG